MATLRQQFTLAARNAGYELKEFGVEGTDGGFVCWEIAIQRLRAGEILTAEPSWHDGVLDLDLEKGEEIEFFNDDGEAIKITFKI